MMCAHATALKCFVHGGGDAAGRRGLTVQRGCRPDIKKRTVLCVKLLS